ncbi:MAG: hypothetical protein SFY68_07820 [Candidatus Sumerlaeia bacterium]|nr:hypothetical protein [Candidatus Sumerlaeia bacterium]
MFPDFSKLFLSSLLLTTPFAVYADESHPATQPVEGAPLVVYDELYYERMGDKASTETLQLIADFQKMRQGDASTAWVDATGGFYYLDLKKGNGKTPEQGQILRVHVRICRGDGTMIGDTLAFREPQQYWLGGQALPAPFEQALGSMQIGGRRLFAVSEDAEMDFEAIVFPFHRDRPKRGDLVFYEITLLGARFDELRNAVKFQ